MSVICHAEACRVMILFIGVSFQTYFITPCAREFLGRACCIWVPPVSFACFLSRPRAPPSHPLSLIWAHAPSSLSSWRPGLRCSPDLKDLLSQLGPPADGRLLPSPLGLATVRGMAAAAASPPAEVAAAATATADAIVPRC